MATDSYAALRWRDGEHRWPARPRRAPRLPKPGTAELHAKVRTLKRQGVEPEHIAERTGLSESMIDQVLRCS